MKNKILMMTFLVSGLGIAYSQTVAPSTRPSPILPSPSQRPANPPMAPGVPGQPAPIQPNQPLQPGQTIAPNNPMFAPTNTPSLPQSGMTNSAPGFNPNPVPPFNGNPVPPFNGSPVPPMATNPVSGFQSSPVSPMTNNPVGR